MVALVFFWLRNADPKFHIDEWLKGKQQNVKTTKYLIPENSKIDFYLQVHGIFSENAKLEMIKNIKKLNLVVSAYEICINDIASKENLIIK